MRIAATVLACMTYAFSADIPAVDSRNVNVPNTDTHFAPPVFKSRAEWEARSEHLRRQVLFAAGLLPMPVKHPLNPQIFGKIERGNYSVEKVLIETMPGYYLGGSLYRPLGRTGKFPAILSPHGHWAYGRLENSTNASIPGRCINLARQGYVVFSGDMVGYNDTIQTPHAFGGQREKLWSFGPLGLQLWNSIRALDFLESLPDVDSARLGVTGESGGGTQTFLLTAVDQRVGFSAPVNMISAIMQGGSPCENAPLLRIGTNNMEIAALMAPRPMLMVSATGDWTRNTPREEFPAIQAIYRLYDKAAYVETVQMDAPHNYNKDSREAVYRFFAKYARPDSKDFVEHGFSIEKPNDLLALFNRTTPSNALTYPQIVEQWIAAAHAQIRPDRDLLRLSLATDWPTKVLSERSGDGIVLSREGVADRVTGILHDGRKLSVILVDADLSETDRSTLRLNVFQPARDHSHEHFLTFNKTDDAERVQDILTALRWLNEPGVTLKCSGNAAIWCTFAAAVAPIPVHLDAVVPDFHGTDQEFIDRFFVPGIQRAGGWSSAVTLAKENSR
jgi:dienelactone hydrolase